MAVLGAGDYGVILKIMIDLFQDPRIVAACISALIASIGVLVSFYTSKAQIKLKQQEITKNNALLEKELLFKSQGIENEIAKMENELESLRQSQISKILDKRIEAYPIVYKTLLKFHRHWLYERKPIDGNWSRNFLTELNKFNEDYGVFLSQPAYNCFAELRGLLIEIDFKLSRGKIASEHEMETLDNIILGKENSPGLGSFLKDDLGSYSVAAIQKRKNKTKDNQSMHLTRKGYGY